MEKDKDPDNKPGLRPIRHRHFVRFSLFIGIAPVIVVFILVNLMTDRFVVDGESMFPVFENGQYLLASRIHYVFVSPERGDVIVFHLPFDPERDLMKRVIALPGDTIEFRDTEVYINGIQVEEPYLAEACNPAMCADAIWQIAEEAYFVMGDNRNHSSDSRSFGAINRELITGLVIIRYYPFSEFGWLHRIGYKNG